MCLAGCGLRVAPLTIPEHDLRASPPSKGPTVNAFAPRLVAYPGLGVSYVANADGEIYHHRGVFYTYFDGNWFYAQSLRGPWTFIEMKYVPSDLFRARGHRPPGVD
ncbi:MAG: hypothetical protein ACYTEZ_04640 [Planctomycetota bacterium]